MDLHPECADSAHPCLPCKLAIWRAEGSSPLTRMQGVAIGTNGENFWNTTIKTEQERIIADAKRGGADPYPVGTRWV